MKLNKINTKTFLKEVSNYQNRIFYSNRGQCLKDAGLDLKIELTVEQVAYIHAVMVVSDSDFIDYGMGYVEIPVELLFTMITPFSVDCYKVKNSKAKSYMADVTLRCIIPLKDIIIFKDKKEGQCRKFAILKQFMEKYYMRQQLSLNNLENRPEIEEGLDYFTKFKRGVGFENPSRLNELTIKAVDKARNSKFVFDTELYKSEEGKEFVKQNLMIPGTNKLNMFALDSLNSTLNFINRKSSQPQYHTCYHLQNSGRVHTVGGCIQMPKWFRNKFIKGVNSNNVRIEFDLKCAQLLILCEILGQPNLRIEILNLLETKGSIWKSIGKPTLDKRVKKIVVYGFCFGAEICHLPFLASREAKRRNLNIKITKKLVADCLGGLISPLVEAREEWLSKYKTINIVKSKEPKLMKNALGYNFSLTQKAVDYYGGYVDSRKDNKTKVGSQLLAFLCQGMEQYYIQSLIANHVEDNILMWAYDGFVLEIKPDKVTTVINNLMTNSLAPLEYEIIL